MKEGLALDKSYILKEIVHSFKYLMQDRRKLALAFLVLIIIPCINIGWKYIDPSISIPSYNNFHFFIWTLGESICMILTSAAWYLSTSKKDFATKLISLASIYYWTFFLVNKMPFGGVIPLYGEIAIFLCAAFLFTRLLMYIKNNFINSRVDYKEEYDGMVYEYHHLCRGFTKTVEGLNYLKEEGYINEEDYNARLSTTTERFDEFAMKIHDRYQKLN